MSTVISPMQLMLSVVERGTGRRLMREYEAYHISQHIQCYGHGTAASHLLDTLGFGTSERDIIISVAPRDTVRQLMGYLRSTDRPSLNIKGIACSVNLSGLGALYAACVSQLEAPDSEKGDYHMEHEARHGLILVAVNQGYTDAVMDTARECGARGGTVIRGRWVGSRTIEKVSGIMLQEEKEILAIVASEQHRKKIMEEINRLHGLRSSPQAIVIGLPVDYTAKLD